MQISLLTVADRDAVAGGTTVRSNAIGTIAEAVTIHGRGGAVMFGIVSRPVLKPLHPRVLVILGKTGPGDVWRWIAESLAHLGFVVLRFEPTGLGDSPGSGPEANIPIEAYFRTVQEGAYAENTEDVVTWVQRTYEPSEVCLLGICGNCSSVLLAAAALPRAVSGVILVTPAVLYSTPRETMRNHDAKVASRQYFGRLLDPSAYVKLLAGRSDYRLLWTIMTWLLLRPVALARLAAAKFNRSPRPNHPAFNWRFWEGFRQVMSQGKPVLALIAELDAERADFNAEFKELVVDRHRDYSRLCSVRLLPGTDHSFLFEEGRHLAFEAIDDWLAATGSIQASIAV